MLLPVASDIVRSARYRIVIKVKVLLHRLELSVPVCIDCIADDNLASIFGLLRCSLVQCALLVTLAQDGLKVKLLTFICFAVLRQLGCGFGNVTLEKTVLQLESSFVIRVIFDICNLFGI